jgi:oligosaccharyltransferase complex subunit beta
VRGSDDKTAALQR